jgi:hypothetical protein
LRRITVDDADTIPEDIAGACPNQKGTLANSEARLNADAKQPYILFFDRSLVVNAKFRKRSPLLPVPIDELPLVQTNRTRVRRRIRFRKLCSASYTNVVGLPHTTTFIIAGTQRPLR